jgi:hypothetical protein
VIERMWRSIRLVASPAIIADFPGLPVGAISLLHPSPEFVREYVCEIGSLAC